MNKWTKTHVVSLASVTSVTNSDFVKGWTLPNRLFDWNSWISWSRFCLHIRLLTVENLTGMILETPRLHRLRVLQVRLGLDSQDGFVRLLGLLVGELRQIRPVDRGALEAECPASLAHHSYILVN